MSGPEHYRAAERCLENAADADTREGAKYWHREAAVHATLALAAATTELLPRRSANGDAWDRALKGEPTRAVEQ